LQPVQLGSIAACGRLNDITIAAPLPTDKGKITAEIAETAEKDREEQR
jgi:hypothetical protein